MLKIKTSLLVLALCAGASLLPAAPKHDLIVWAHVTNNFIVGSKLTIPSGMFVRDADGQYKHSGLNFPFLFNHTVDPRDPNVFYVASLNGVQITRDGGKTWRQGTGWDATEPKDVFLDPNAPDTIYLGLPDGIMVSRDAGATWVRQENGLPARGKYTQVIKVDRTKAGRVLAGCEAGIYLTTDAAKSWKQVFAAKTTITDLRQSPHDANHWIATTQADGVIESRDGGVKWTKLAGLQSADAWYNIAFDAANPQRLAIASWTYGAYVTEDGGKTWSARNDGLPDDHCVFRVGIDPDSGRLYASVYKDAVYRSDDFGRTWIKDGLEGSFVYNFVFQPKAAK
ncbi:WD40/YVTN/BNR-like repeat-containing protein [Oleiharenicola lentus]|uniref:WD40/YVTN/BNR-like repeat-containing protein n=1 Tax=Oleiharenicola lentus TaxID=2508720 RepID=UPI003F681689